jgi:hypothetical protein
MSFGESMFLAGFIQKIVKRDLFIKGNYGISLRKKREKILEDSRRIPSEVDPEGLPCGASRPHLEAGRPMGPTSQPPLQMLVSHRLLDCIYAIYSIRIDRWLKIDASTYIYQPLPPPSGDS